MSCQIFSNEWLKFRRMKKNKVRQATSLKGLSKDFINNLRQSDEWGLVLQASIGEMICFYANNLQLPIYISQELIKAYLFEHGIQKEATINEILKQYTDQRNIKLQEANRGPSKQIV